jgi:CTP:molybdopterin cytidylyltransferase MocA
VSARGVLGVVLAAGGSSRLGRPKQLLVHRGVPLVRGAALAACASACTEVVVVVGASAAEVTQALDGLPVTIVVNADWASGMGSSIRCGVARASSGGHDAALVMLCDQPALTTLHLERLLSAHAPGRSVASRYEGVLGVPAVLDRATFAQLLSLEGAAGARQVLRAAEDVVAVDWPEGAIDVDTPEDAARLSPAS